MQINRAVITAASRSQRTLPLQTLIDRDGTPKSVLGILIEEVLRAGVQEICVVVCPGDEDTYTRVAGEHSARIRFVPQNEPRGYGHAVLCAREFVGDQPFLLLVGDHLYVQRGSKGCAEQLVELAANESCAVSAVQASREHLLPYYGAVGGRRVSGQQDLYLIEDVLEKPTPTAAEQRLVVPGLRAGHYLCFFGMHVLTPTIMELLARQVAEANERLVNLSDSLAQLACRERYLALVTQGWRYDVGVKYGLLSAQLALALSGRDRDEVLTNLVEILAQRELGMSERA